MNRRTALITAAAVAGAVLAGTTAVAANIGILNSAESSAIGDLNATAELAPTVTPPTAPEPQVVDIYIDEPTPSTVVTPTTTLTENETTTSQEFAVDDAGTLTVERTATGVRVGEVVAMPGWEWESAQTSDGALVVTFTSGDTTYVFSAELDADGAISARVDQPIVRTVRIPAPASSASSSSSTAAGGAAPATAPQAPESYDDDDDDDDSEHDEDEEHEDEEHDEDEHEGGDDDD